jgi:cysteine sulfinate desulfinase/cysteine desulfurase-like protein
MKKLCDLTASQKFIKELDDQNDTSIEISFKKLQKIDFLKKRLLQALKLDGFSEVLIFPTRASFETALFFHIYFKHVQETGKNQFIVKANQSLSFLDLLKKAKRFQVIATLCALNAEGELDLDVLKKQLSSKTIFYSQSLFDPILGVHDSQYLEALAELKKQEVLVHFDVSQTFGEKFFDFTGIDADFISLDLSSLSKELNGVICFSKEKIQTLNCLQLEPNFSFFEKVERAFESFFDISSENMLKNIQIKTKLKELILEKIPEAEFMMDSLNAGLKTILVYLPNVHAKALMKLLLDYQILIEVGGDEKLELVELLNLCGVSSQKGLSAFCMTLDSDLEESDLENIALSLQSAYSSLLKGAF